MNNQKPQLIAEWMEATGKAIIALGAWRRWLEGWLHNDNISDEEFMAAYKTLTDEIGTDWADTSVWWSGGIDRLREVVTGVDLTAPVDVDVSGS